MEALGEGARGGARARRDTPGARGRCQIVQLPTAPGVPGARGARRGARGRRGRCQIVQLPAAPGLNLFGRSLPLHARGGRVHRLPRDSKTTGQVPAAPPQPSYPYVASTARARRPLHPCPRPTRLQRSPHSASNPPRQDGKVHPLPSPPFLSFRAPENLSHKARTPQNPLIRLIRFTPPAQESDRFPERAKGKGGTLLTKWTIFGMSSAFLFR